MTFNPDQARDQYGRWAAERDAEGEWTKEGTAAQQEKWLAQWKAEGHFGSPWPSYFKDMAFKEAHPEESKPIGDHNRTEQDMKRIDDPRYGVREELDQKDPIIGKEFIVYRAANEERATLEMRNAGNAYGVADFLVDNQDDEKDMQIGGYPTRIYAYAVTLTEDPGSFERLDALRKSSREDVGRSHKYAYAPGQASGVWYSFHGEGKGYTSRLLGSASLDEVHSTIRRLSKEKNFYMAGGNVGGDAIRLTKFSPPGHNSERSVRVVESPIRAMRAAPRTPEGEEPRFSKLGYRL